MSKILLVGKGAPERGGIPSFLDLLRHSDLADDHEVRFLNVAHHGTPQAGRLTTSNLWHTALDAAAVWRAARGQDIVHIHSALSGTTTVLRACALALAARAGGCRVIVHVHGGGIANWLTTRQRKLLVGFGLRPAHLVVPVWTAGERLLREVLSADRVRLVENGVRVDALPEPETAHTPPRVLYVGLLTPRKGVLDLAEASRLLHERGVEHELWLLGGTPDEGPEAEERVRDRLDSGVRLLGTRSPEQMPAAYAEADVLCLPSWWEAMPLSVLEAMAVGLPVVATDVGDVSRAIVDGVTGYVVPPRSPVQLADALERLLVDPQLRQHMGTAGRERVHEHFSSGSTVAAVSDLYTELEQAR